jgi:hypothetical protein
MISGSFPIFANSPWIIPYHTAEMLNNTRKFPKVNHVPVKYHKNIKNITIKQASLKSIVAILAKKLVLYCRCSLNAYFRNCKYFFMVIC